MGQACVVHARSFDFAPLRLRMTSVKRVAYDDVLKNIDVMPHPIRLCYSFLCAAFIKMPGSLCCSRPGYRS